ncbi:uncharacterized protein Z518_02508 [Rhinocladiella mackenziei CBS 650.93]|uniref:DUF676 domain-containing protein n=1 Tax=Rhinocladiella mackenziei CBS 650.93 TaxID=1442369 RepID=A0A0D2IPN3_9EURO|nr:uncharacterized protein Z518_02508 [Rhinocladiella mackenziei CBS 650.93]KIX07854.1 hypothetical protein Z518_02508 [Rhinocladiella mackenziei CBS 650.93]
MPWKFPRLHAGLRPPALQCIRYQSTLSSPPPHLNPGSKANRDTGSSSNVENPIDPGLSDLGRLITDDFAHVRSHYSVPRHLIVLAHGLMGFDELRLVGRYLPSIQYWRGITDAFAQNGIEFITTAVPTMGSIEDRARALASQIATKAPGRDVNIVAHSMGGLDARYVISRLCPPREASPSPRRPFRVRSLTTIATPHRGSSAADMIYNFDFKFNTRGSPDGAYALGPRISRTLERLRIDARAFSQLTTTYMTQHFNPSTPDDPNVRYFSYGASATPHFLSVFRLSHDLITPREGANDGLVSVASARWGEYRGTLVGVTHLDLINWSNRLLRVAAGVGLVQERFNAVAFYLGVADALAQDGF